MQFRIEKINRVQLFIAGLVWFLVSIIMIQYLDSAKAQAMSADAIVALTNVERQKAGLTQLRYNSQLSQSAQSKAADMMARGYWAHNSPEGTEPWVFISSVGYEYSQAGENLARNFSTESSTVSGWMNSPGHRANILEAHYEEIGVAIVAGTMDGRMTELVVVHYAKPVKKANSRATAAATPAVMPEAQITLDQPRQLKLSPRELWQKAMSDIQQLMIKTPIISRFSS